MNAHRGPLGLYIRAKRRGRLYKREGRTADLERERALCDDLWQQLSPRERELARRELAEG